MDADRPVTVSPTAANVLPFFPTLSREFVGGTRISLYVEAYSNARGRDPKSIELKVDVRDQHGAIPKRTR